MYIYICVCVCVCVCVSIYIYTKIQCEWIFICLPSRVAWHLQVPVHNYNTICLASKLRIRRLLLFFMGKGILDSQIL